MREECWDREGVYGEEGGGGWGRGRGEERGGGKGGEEGGGGVGEGRVLGLGMGCLISVGRPHRNKKRERLKEKRITWKIGIAMYRGMRNNGKKVGDIF